MRFNHIHNRKTIPCVSKDNRQLLFVEVCNLRSICNKFNLVTTYLKSHQQLDLLFVTESWLKPKHNDAMFCPTGYQSIRCDRKGSKKGGGVVVLYKSNLQIIQVELSMNENCKYEIVCVDVHGNNSVIRVCCVYIPPSQDESVVFDLCKTLRKVLHVTTPVLIIGDLNFPHIDWTVPCVTDKGDKAHTAFLDFCSSNALSQCVDFPTHCKRNILDLVLCNAKGRDILDNVDSHAPPWDADHFLISFSLNFFPMRSSSVEIQTPDFNGANYDLIKYDLNLINWDSICKPDNTLQSIYDNFILILNSHFSKHVPYKRKRAHKPLKKPKHIRLLLRKKQVVYKQLKQDPSKKDAYKDASKAYTSAINKWHDQVESRICTNPHSKKLFNYANKKLKINNVIPPLFDENKNIMFSDIDKANFLNHSFQQFFTKDASSHNPTYQPPPTFMQNFEVLPEDILLACRKMKNKISRTPEGIPSFFIKRTILSLIQPLCFIFNHFLKSGFVPKQWKRSLIIPIFKKGSRGNPSNYRPISLTSSFCRLFESILCEKMMQHLLSNSLLSPNQFGFVPHKTSCDQLLTCLDKWYTAFLNNENMSVLYTDISKAFDSVSHNLLVQNLNLYGINYEVVYWLRNFLKDRHQQVCIGSSISTPLPVFSGVPQGSVIGPLLFLIFINGISSVVIRDSNVNISMFADDTKIFGTCPIQMQASVDSMTTWIQDNKLTLATHKCVVLNVKKSHIPDNNFYINGNLLESKPAVKDLGVYVSNDLKWSKHVSHICQQANVVSYRILKTFRTRNIWTFIKLYKTYIRPKLEYNTPVWSPYLDGDKKRIEQVQRHFTKVAFNKCNIPFTSYKDRLYKISMSTLENRRAYFDTVCLFKIINGLSDLEFNDYFQFRHTPYELRSHPFQVTPKIQPTLAQWQGSFFVRAPKFWNALPANIVATKSLPIFKSRIKSYKFVSVPR